MAYDEDGKPVPNDYHNFADIGPRAASLIVRVAQGGFLIMLLWLARVPLNGPRQGLRFSAECAIIVLGMLLFSERTWKHHATTTALPMAVLVGAWATRELGLRARIVLCFTLTAAVVLMLVPSFLNEHLQDLCLIYGTHTLGFLLLLGLCYFVLWHDNRQVRLHPGDYGIHLST
jgi:hypothetical protein